MEIEFIIYILFLNAISFFLCIFDKKLAIKRKYRISEKIFIFLSSIGGVFGFLLASLLFRHKIKKKKFIGIIYTILIIWIFMLIYTNI